MRSLQWLECDVCQERIIASCPEPKISGSCRACRKHPARFTHHNNMNPGDVPPELACLSPVEKQLIASVHPVISVYRINGQQFSYRGIVINFPQNVAEFVTRLPHTVCTLSSVLVVRRGTVENHSDFNVDRERVLLALRWLKAHNPAYHDITIDDELLMSLPVNGNIMQDLQTVLGEEIPQALAAKVSEDLQDSNPDLLQSDVPLAGDIGQAEQIEHQLQYGSKHNPLQWPVTGTNPINEYNTEYYIVRAFPSLFPWGRADLRSPRAETVTPTETFSI